MSLIFDRTGRKNNITRELYYDKESDMQLQFLGDNMITVWSSTSVWLMNEIGGVYNEGWVWYEKRTVIFPDGRVV